MNDDFGPPAPPGLVSFVLDSAGEVPIVVMHAPICDVEHNEIADGLSPAEEDVTLLAARGMTTAEIAVSRNTSARTVDEQLQRVFRKLGIATREELAVLLLGGQPPDRRR